MGVVCLAGNVIRSAVTSSMLVYSAHDVMAADFLS